MAEGGVLDSLKQPDTIFVLASIVLLAVSIGVYFGLSGCKPACDDFEKKITVEQAHEALRNVARSNSAQFVDNFFDKIKPSTCGIEQKDKTLDEI